jgi:hypothetical protein
MVVLAKARTHYPREEFSEERWYGHLSPTRDHAVWVLAFARTTSECWAEKNYPSILAGRSSTDSPQPQAEIWFGLLKTNWACILSAL